MATRLRRGALTAAVLATAINSLRAADGAIVRQSGRATLTAGTVTITGVKLTAGSRITYARVTTGTAAGHLSAPSASRTAGLAGQFVIQSSDNTETSTVDWMVETPLAHLDASEYAIAAADATDTATAITLVNEIKAVYELHLADTLAHKAEDTAPALTKASNLATAITLANAIKSDYNTHRASTTYHYEADALNATAASNASDEGTLVTLVNELKADLTAHLAQAPAGASIRLADA